MSTDPWDIVAEAYLASGKVQPVDAICDAAKREMELQGGPGGCVRYYPFLFHVARLLRPTLTVEIGTSCGWGTTHLARGYPEGRVVSIDSVSRVDEEPLRGTLQACGNIEAWVGSSESPEIHSRLSDIDLLFVDSSHMDNQPELDWAIYSGKVRAGGIMLFDDIRLGEAMCSWWAGIPVPKAEFPGLHEGVSFGVIVSPKPQG